MDKRENQEMSTNSQTDPKSSRRRFLRKASAGALIATIPAQSVWATGLTNSVVASGHGSDVGGGQQLVLKHHDYYYDYRSSLNAILDKTFVSVFNVYPVTENGSAHTDPLTIGDIFTKDDSGKYAHPGINDFNLMMISTYINAAHHDHVGVHFPVIGPGSSFESLDQFGKSLGAMASGSTSTVSGVSASSFATELKQLHGGTHNLMLNN